MSRVPETMPSLCQVQSTPTTGSPHALPVLAATQELSAMEGNLFERELEDKEVTDQRCDREQPADQQITRSQVAKAAGLKLPLRSSQKSDQVQKITHR